jgi:2-oxoglutarate dehydrogenase E2 component (dihydrolipoamide succinyltransferase)
MAQQVKVPTVGESITEVTIANWLKNDGDVVKMDEVIAELESDKATFELTAPQAGVLKLRKQRVKWCLLVRYLCEIADGGKHLLLKAAETKPATTTASAKSNRWNKEMKVPAVGESITEVTISTWLKKDGDRCKLDEVIAEVESDKATFELTC